MKEFELSTITNNPLRFVNYQHSSLNSDMLPMVRYCILPGTVQYGTVLTYSNSLDIHPDLERKSLILKRSPNQLFIDVIFCTWLLSTRYFQNEPLFINWCETKNS